MKIKSILKSIFKYFGYITAVITLAALLVAIRIAGHFMQITPEAFALVERDIAQSSILYDRTGQHVLYEIHGDENRKILTHEQIPDVMRVATVAIEDDSFYEHHGFDLAAIARAAYVNAKSETIRQGASTITQQLARNAFLNKEKTFDRKLKELALAIKIERTFSKDDILDQYLNEVSYGSNIFGIQKASEEYFRKDAKDLTLSEAAFLASLTKAPSFFSPYGANKEALLERHRLVLDRIEQLNLADKKEIGEARKESIVVHPITSPIEVPHFVFYVLEQLEAQYGREVVQQGGLRITTTIDLELQAQAQKIVAEGAEENLGRYNAENAALVAINPKNGEILTMVGSRDFYDEDIDGQVNVAARPRQPGSAFKPLVYAKAFEKGFQPETYLYDVRTDFGSDGVRNYVPNNYDGQFRGLVTMRQALAMSLNIPAVKTLYLAGVEDSVSFSKKLGVSSLGERKFGLSLVLGGGDITLVEGVGAYSVFANDGLRAPTTPVVEISYWDGRPFKHKRAAPTLSIDRETARKINSVLSDNAARTPVFGSSSDLFIEGRQVAAKTGTTQEYRDAWTIGYTPSIAVGVWAGNNDNTPMRSGAAGTFVAAPIWNKFMKLVLEKYPEESFAEYQKVESDNFMVTGKLEQSVAYYKGDKRISEEKRKKTDPEKVEQRTTTARRPILHYVNKDDPLSGAPPDKKDPMLQRWARGLSG